MKKDTLGSIAKSGANIKKTLSRISRLRDASARNFDLSNNSKSSTLLIASAKIRDNNQQVAINFTKGLAKLFDRLKSDIWFAKENKIDEKMLVNMLAENLTPAIEDSVRTTLKMRNKAISNDKIKALVVAETKKTFKLLKVGSDQTLLEKAINSNIKNSSDIKPETKQGTLKDILRKDKLRQNHAYTSKKMVKGRMRYYYD